MTNCVRQPRHSPAAVSRRSGDARRQMRPQQPPPHTHLSSARRTTSFVPAADSSQPRNIAGVQHPAVRLDRRDDAPLRWWNRSARRRVSQRDDQRELGRTRAAVAPRRSPSARGSAPLRLSPRIPPAPSRIVGSPVRPSRPVAVKDLEAAAEPVQAETSVVPDGMIVPVSVFLEVDLAPGRDSRVLRPRRAWRRRRPRRRRPRRSGRPSRRCASRRRPARRWSRRRGGPAPRPAACAQLGRWLLRPARAASYLKPKRERRKGARRLDSTGSRGYPAASSTPHDSRKTQLKPALEDCRSLRRSLR